MQDCILFNEYFLAQRLNPVFDVTDDVIACFQHHVACGGKHLEWQSLSHKNWWWLGLNAVKIFSYDSKFKLKVTRWLIWKKILISLAEKAWLYANLSDLWTIQYGHFVSKRFLRSISDEDCTRTSHAPFGTLMKTSRMGLNFPRSS